jgi:CRP/FNR family transcriptional regulator, anaerobic regulatory protein
MEEARMNLEPISVEEFTEIFPCFYQQQELTEGLLKQAHKHHFSAGIHLYWEGDRCDGIAFVLSGTIRVYRCSENGREITLYEIGSGETCILNASCILTGKPYPANAVTLGESELVLVPAANFRRLLDTHEVLRAMVFSLLSERLG